MTVDLVLRIGWRTDGIATSADGKFIVDYDPTIRRDRTYLLETTADIDKARGFSRVAECWNFVRQPCPNIPFDSPGHVNRPLTAFHIEIIPRTRP